MITIYSTPTCPRCKSVMAWCRANNVDFCEKSLVDMPGADRAECICSLGFVPVEAPVVEIDGEWLHGDAVLERFK